MSAIAENKSSDREQGKPKEKNNRVRRHKEQEERTQQNWHERGHNERTIMTEEVRKRERK